ncbi:MFS transporter [Streptomyces sp. NBC_01198]|uniref:MFS transporter n=1 Tax=Streptomyces sp. NBC_01198 TaxID=2903769 RepID=UPI002E15B058|nr:MFS transporter [Streptomyces sp. NBC_01198]
MPSPEDSTARAPGYRQLLGTPGVWAFVLPGFAARQPFAMLTISIVLLVEHTTGSFGTAGAVAAVTGVAMAVCSPRGGRLADRFGQRAVLVPGIALHAASVSALVALGLAHVPVWVLFAAAVPTGATVPQIGPMVRSRWAVTLDGLSPGRSPLMQTAAAFESVTDEFTFVIGPVLATALCTGVHPAAGLIAEAALTLAGGSLFAVQRKTAPVPHRMGAGSARRSASALSIPGVRALVIAFLGIGAVFGGMQVSITAFTKEAGHPGLSGVVYGIFAAANMLAGVVYGAVTWRRSPRLRLLAAYTALALACGPLWAVQALPVLGVLGLVVGLCIAPALITGYTLVDALVPSSARTEAFTWLTGAVALGQAAAVTVAGLLADRAGAHAGFTVPLTGTVVALVMLVGLRRHLVPGQRGVVASGVIGHRRGVTVD